MFGWGRSAEVEARAKLLARMIGLIVHARKTKSYEQFAAAYSNPGHEPDALARSSGKAHFVMRISPSCWYDASVAYFREDPPWLCLSGGGDDNGVYITASLVADGIGVDLHPADGQKAGRDARAMVRALLSLPGYRRDHASEDSLGVLPDFPA